MDTIEAMVEAPGWSIIRRGKSGSPYRLRFYANGRLYSIESKIMPSGRIYRSSIYWASVWNRTRVRRGDRPAVRVWGKRSVAAFEDLGIDDPVAFINARHVCLRREPCPTA